jgi:quercetin dioxygenase-like cupin family protein
VAVRDLARFPLHLGLGATAIAQPEFTGMAWYGDYMTRHAVDGAEGRLVAIHHFTDNWQAWEMHPLGEEVVVCIAGELTLIQQNTGGIQQSAGGIQQNAGGIQEDVAGDELRITLKVGEYAINPRGVWHTADIAGAASVLFITAGAGTEHRER